MNSQKRKKKMPTIAISKFGEFSRSPESLSIEVTLRGFMGMGLGVEQSSTNYLPPRDPLRAFSK